MDLDHRLDKRDADAGEPRRTRAVVVTACFLITLQIGWLSELGSGRSVLPQALAQLGQSWRLASAESMTLTAAGHELARGSTALATRLGHDTSLARGLRHAAQWLLTAGFGHGNELAVSASGGLHYHHDLGHLTGPGFLQAEALQRRRRAGVAHPDPRPAILDLHAALDARGIALVVLPTPGSAALATKPGQVLANPSHRQLLSELAARGVTVLDPTEFLAPRGDSADAALSTDTHWTPQEMDSVAKRLARLIESRVPALQAPGVDYARQPVRVRFQGDMERLLGLPGALPILEPNDVTILEVRGPAGEPARPTPRAPVLLLGDSYSIVYSAPVLATGASAGLAEQLSYHLGHPSDRIASVDNGAFQSRQRLARELARGSDRLAGTKVVVWQFALRELSHGDWTPLSLAEGRAPQPGPVQPSALARGIVVELGRLPAPRTSPYAEAIIALRVRPIRVSQGSLPHAEILVYAWGMLEHEWTAAGHSVIGQEIDLRVVPWEQVAPRYDRYQRSELDDPRAVLLPAFWQIREDGP